MDGRLKDNSWAALVVAIRPEIGAMLIFASNGGLSLRVGLIDIVLLACSQI